MVHSGPRVLREPQWTGRASSTSTHRHSFGEPPAPQASDKAAPKLGRKPGWHQSSVPRVQRGLRKNRGSGASWSLGAEGDEVDQGGLGDRSFETP